MISKKIFLFIGLSLAVLNNSMAQQVTPEQQMPYFVLYGVNLWPKDSSFIGIKADSILAPSYKKGWKNLYEYFMVNASVKGVAKKRGFTGITRAEVLFNDSGNVEMVNVLHASYEELKSELIRILNGMPAWEPLYINGTPTPFKVKLFIPFADEISMSEDGFLIYCKRYDTDRKGKETKYSSFSFYNAEEAADFKNKGIELLIEKNFSAALKMFSIYLTLIPGDIDCLFNRAMCYQKLNRIKDACDDWLNASRRGDSESEQLFGKNCK